MPEMHFSVRWPDRSETRCYSPSLVIEDFFTPGSEYGLRDFLERSRAALSAASERVRQRYGFPCSRALGQLAEIEWRADAFAEQADASVTIIAFHTD